MRKKKENKNKKKTNEKIREKRPMRKKKENKRERRKGHLRSAGKGRHNYVKTGFGFGVSSRGWC